MKNMGYGLVENVREYDISALQRAYHKIKIGLEGVIDDAKTIGLGVTMISVGLMILPFIIYANTKIERKFKKKYGINVNDLNDEEYHTLLLMEIVERDNKDHKLDPELEAIKKQILKNHYDLKEL